VYTLFPAMYRCASPAAAAEGSTIRSSSAMPIYEFYCRDCHTIFSFFSATVGAERTPGCPRCGRAELERRPSTFAMLRRRTGGAGEDEGDEGDDPFVGLDEERVERAMESLAGEMERMGDTEDPKALGTLFRRFGELTGLEPGPRMQEALSRLETGEDIEAIEGDLDLAEDSDDLSELFQLRKKLLRRARRPRVDDTLHFL
jgi:putative FmdB family regulatory protein